MIALLKFKPALYIVVLMAAFIAGWQVHAWRIKSTYHDTYVQTVHVINEAQTQSQQLADATESKINQNDEAINEVKKNVQIHIIKEPVFDSCSVPAGGVLNINAAAERINQITATL